MNTITNPFKLKKTKALKSMLAPDTLEGGTEGSDDSTPEASSAYSVEMKSDFDHTLVMCLDALLDMHGAALASDRESLDSAYATLVTLCEVYRDGVPKA